MLVDMKPRERIRLDNRITLTVLQVIDDQIIFSLESTEEVGMEEQFLPWKAHLAKEAFPWSRLEPPSLS